jgi:hypothetical protein
MPTIDTAGDADGTSAGNEGSPKTLADQYRGSRVGVSNGHEVDGDSHAHDGTALFDVDLKFFGFAADFLLLLG